MIVKIISFMVLLLGFSGGNFFPEDLYHYTNDSMEFIYFKSYNNWNPNVSLPNTAVNNLITNQTGYVDNFHNVTLKAIGVWMDDTHTPRNTFRMVNGHLQFDQGWMSSLINDLAYILNFSIYAIESRVLTTEDVNGTLTGPGGLITSGKADIVIGLMYVFPNRLRALRPAHTLGTYRLSLMFRQPKIGGVRNVFTEPFSGETWAFILGFVIVIVISSLICCQIETFYLLENYHMDEIIPWVGGIVLSQGFFNPTTIPTRIIVMAALITVVVLSNSYSAFLISYLAQEHVPIQSVADLVTYKYTIIVDKYNEYTCSAIFPVNSKELRNYCGSNYKSEEDSINKLYRDDKGRYAFVKTMDQVALTASHLKYANREICGVTQFPLPDKIPITPIYGLRKSPLMQILNPKLLRINERGVNRRYQHTYSDMTMLKCEREKFLYDPDVQLTDLYIAFCILLFGLLASSLGCLCEKLVNRQMNFTTVVEFDYFAENDCGHDDDKRT